MGGLHTALGKGLAFGRFALLKRAHIVVHVKKIPSAEFNVLAVVQQFVLSKMFPYPTFTEEEMKAIEKEMNSSVRKEKKKPSASLHHIDDDDEPAKAPRQAEKPKPLSDGDVPVLKEDRKYFFVEHFLNFTVCKEPFPFRGERYRCCRS